MLTDWCANPAALPRARPAGVVVHAHGIDVHCKYELLCAREPGGAHDCYEGSLAQRITEGGCCHVVGLDHQSYGESEGALEGYRSFFWKVRAHVRDHVRPLLCVCGTRLYRRRCFACVRVAFAPRREQMLACADTPSRPRQLSLTTSWRTSCS